MDFDIPAPQPIYMSALYGRYNSTVSPTTMMYGEDAKAADVWQKIERRESLVKKPAYNRASQPVELPIEDLEDINLNGDSKEWRQTKRPATPVARLSSGPGSFDSASNIETENTEDSVAEQDDTSAHSHEDKEDVDVTYSPQPTDTNRLSDTNAVTYVSSTRHSHRGGRSLTYRDSQNLLPAANHISQRSSWSTHSNRSPRGSTENTPQDIHETPSRTLSARGSVSTPSRNSSTVSGLRFLGRSSADMLRWVSTEKVGRGRNSVPKKDLVGYADSDEE
jgi:hypothetical protein